MNPTSIEEFYQQIRQTSPDNISKGHGHFNVFRLEDIHTGAQSSVIMPYDKRVYYKISLIKGKYRAEYADKTIEVKNNALLFATPKIPYNWVPLEGRQIGYFCIFTSEFIDDARVDLESLPIYAPGGCPVFELDDSAFDEISEIFKKMEREVAGGYAFKEDLLRNFILELIHNGQKLQPAGMEVYKEHNGSTRVFSLFIEILDRQFPIESPRQKLELKNPTAYADRLAIHVNYLNRIIKERSGHTTTAFINERIMREAKILLKQAEWSISDISFSLGYEEIAHFSNAFRKHTSLSPSEYRNQ